MSRSRAFMAALASLLAFATVRPVAATTRAANIANIPVCVATGDQGSPGGVSDGAGGTIVTWQDFRSGSDVYAQRLSAAGVPLWTANGIAVCSGAGSHTSPVIASDGAGGAIIAWLDVRGTAVNYDIYAQRISATGVPQWPAGGVALCSAAGDQVDHHVVADGAGGAIVAWADFRSGTSWDVYAQRVNGAGAPQWTADGVALCTAPSVPPFVLSWGSHGSAATQFNTPTGVGADLYGNVYVADQSNHRILKFDILGNLILQWGSYGAGNNQFNLPTAVTADAGGNLYVADMGNNRVVKFTSTGGYLAQWGVAGTGNGQFYLPSGVAVDPVSGSVFVSDGANHRIQKFTDTGSYLAQWGSPGSGNGQFMAPYGVCTDAAGNVYVADQSNNRIQKFTSAGAYLTQWGGAGAGNGQLSLPMGVAVDVYGSVWVADRGNHRIQEFTGTGGYVVRTGSLGSGSGQFDSPMGLAVDAAGNLFVADTGNDRIQRFATMPAAEHFVPAIAPDGAGGAIVAWHDYRGAGSLDLDIYAQRVSAAGAPQWVADGVALCKASGVQDDPAVLADGSGGAIVSWVDYRSGTNADIYVQRVNASGAVQWPANGVALCTAPGDQYAPSTDGQGMVSDGAGGAIAAWQDGRNGVADDIYAQRISASGAPQWAANGVALCTATDFQFHPRVVSDGSGGMIASWYDYRTGTNADVYAQRVSASGVPQWTSDGEALCTDPGDQESPRVIADGSGGAFAVWSDFRNGADWDVYAQHVSHVGTLGVAGDGPGAAPAILAFAAPWPNPATGAATLDYTLSRAGHVRLSVYDVAGRRVQVVREGDLAAGAHREALSLRDPAGHELASGLYLLRLEAEGRVLTRRLATIH